MLNENENYFLSESFSKYIEKTTNDVLGIKAKYQQQRNCTPCTDGKTITYDPYPKSFRDDKLSREQTSTCVLGDTFHEGLHVRFSICEIFPAIVKLNYVSANIPSRYHLFMKYIIDKCSKLKPKQREFLQHLFNLIEDSAIEYCGKKTSNFVSKCLILSNSIIFSKKDNSLNSRNTDIKEIVYLVSAYSIMGSINGEISNHIKPLFTEKLKPLIIKGRLEKDSFGRFNVAFKIYEAIVEFMNEQQKKSNDIEESFEVSDLKEDSDLEEDVFGNFLSLFVFEKSGMSFGNINPLVITSLGYNSELPVSEETKAFLLNIEKMELPENELDFSNFQTITEEEIETFANNEKPYTSEELNTLMKEIADTLISVEREFKKEKQSDSAAIEEEMKNLKVTPLEYPSSLNKKVTINKKIEYMKSYNKEVYLELKKENNSIINAFVREIETMLKNRRDKKYYSSRGKLAQNKLYKTKFSQNTYYKVIESNNPPKMAIVVLVDLSASCANERLQYAKESCVVLIEVCEKLDIPISIVGHNASYPDFYFYYFKRFEGTKDKYAIPTMTAEHSNRDNVALLIASEMLLRRPEERKILITLTDGEPSDTHYSGEPARADMLKLSSFLEKKGISLTGVAISGNKSENDKIARCYKNSISILNLKELQKELLKFLKPLF